MNLTSNYFTFGNSLSFMLNFKIWNMNNLTNKKETNIMKFNFTSGKSLSIDLDYTTYNLTMKEMKNIKSLKKLAPNEYINLVIILTGKEKAINFYFLLNGESQLNPIKYPNTDITYKDKIDSIQFFNNFFGEVSSILLLSQNKDLESSLIPPSDFLSELKLFKEGLWKRKVLNNFFDLIKKVNNKKKNKLKIIFIFSAKNKINKEKEKKIENIIYNSNNSNNNLFLNFTGNIRCHKYECYQKKLFLLNGITNILPIGELFLLHSSLLNNVNFELIQI